MNTQKLNVNGMGLTQLSLTDAMTIDGGDADGLMRGSTPDLQKVVNGVVTVVHNVGDFLKGLWHGLAD
jgi:hypothetical protein